MLAGIYKTCPAPTFRFLPPELVPQIPVMKNSIVDVRCMDARGRHFIVERTLLADSLAEGEQIGLEKGRVEGRVEGEQIGLEKGMKEALALLIASGVEEPEARKIQRLAP